MNKRALRKLNGAIAKSRLHDLAAWYAAHKPAVGVIRIYPELADVLLEHREEAQSLGFEITDSAIRGMPERDQPTHISFRNFTLAPYSASGSTPS